jgi:hypothetical protein
MKFTLILLLLVSLSACVSQRVESQSKTEMKTISRQPVLVELFTSEGCDSCPPADRELTFLDKYQPFANAEIIPLEMHVDYWDRLGWKDEFSQGLFTQRQQIYADILNGGTSYTPQMVVDGRIEFTGSNLAKIQRLIPEAARESKSKIELQITKENNLQIKIADLGIHETASIIVVIAEDKLFTDVKNGENAGERLEHNVVARELRSIANVAPEEKSYAGETQVSFQQNWKRENLRIVVFAQENRSRKILGVSQMRLPA